MLLPLGGLGILIWLYFLVDWLFTIYEIYTGVIVVRSGLTKRTKIFVRYYHIEDMDLVRNVFDLISGNARIILIVDQRKEEAGKLHGFSTPNTPVGGSDTGPKRKTIVLRGLGNSRQMDALFDALMEWVSEYRHIVQYWGR